MPDSDSVAAWLRDNPRFLAERPELYAVLDPPVRRHGETIADHMEARLRAERARAQEMAARADGVLAAGRASAGLMQRVQEAVLLLLAADDVAECVAAEFPGALAVDAACLCVEDGGVGNGGVEDGNAGGAISGARLLPQGMVKTLLGGRSVVYRAGAAEVALHGEAVRLAAHEALVRIPRHGPPALLALASRGEAMLDPAQGSGALTFLGRALAAALR